MPPYNQLIQDLKALLEQNPGFSSTLLAVISYLEDTSEMYDRFVLDNLDNLDDMDEDMDEDDEDDDW